MKAPNNALLGSIAGVCIASAVVVGAVLGTHDQAKTPAQRPAGNLAPAAAAASTVTVTASARPTVQQVAKVSPSKRTALVHQQANRPAAVVNQEPPVTDPSTTPPVVDLGSGTVDEGGVRRAPAPTSHAAPPPMQHGPQPDPTP